MRCIFIYSSEAKYEVSTPYGWVRLDEGAYRDYLDGKIWLNWVPKSKQTVNSMTVSTLQQELMPEVTKEAISLRDSAERNGIFWVLRENFPGKQAELPYRSRMSETPIEEMNLSVRSTNGLKRANAHTFAKLKELMERETGLRGVRNLGVKSETEIWHGFFSTCYSMLTQGEKAFFWQKLLDSCGKGR